MKANCVKNSLKQHKAGLRILAVSQAGHTGLLAGVRGVLGTFQLVMLRDQLEDQLHNSLARLGDQLKTAKTSKPVQAGFNIFFQQWIVMFQLREPTLRTIKNNNKLIHF